MKYTFKVPASKTEQTVSVTIPDPVALPATVTPVITGTTPLDPPVVVTPPVVDPPPVIVPGKYMGFGSGVTGGNDRTVREVSDLSYNGIMNAIQGGNCLIKFKTDKPVTIPFRLESSSLKNVTIDGGGLVTLDGNKYGGTIFGLEAGCENIVFTNLKLRNGGAYDCIGVRCKYVVVDHCSFDGSLDGLCDLTEGAEFCTIQYSIFGSAANGAMLIAYIGTRNLSVHHNLFTSFERNPFVHRASGTYPQSKANPTEDLMCEFGNNVVANFTNYGSCADWGGTMQLKSNYYVKPDNAIVINRESTGGAIFCSGNIAKGGAPVGKSNHAEWIIPAQYQVPYTDALTAMTIVKQQAGAANPDTRDQALLKLIQ